MDALWLLMIRSESCGHSARTAWTVVSHRVRASARGTAPVAEVIDVAVGSPDALEDSLARVTGCRSATGSQA